MFRRKSKLRSLRSRLIADPHEVLRIIDDMEDSELSNEDDCETDEEAEISLAVTSYAGPF